MNKRGNFYGILLALLMFVSLIALFTAEPEITGFVVKEAQQDKIIVLETTQEQDSCSGALQHGSCSNTRPLFCDSGNLIYNCYECGCDEGKTCSEQGVCDPIRNCADGSIYGECSFLRGKFCADGTLINNCELCGCDEGEICSNTKCVKQWILYTKQNK